jgi:hypothetical protein
MITNEESKLPQHLLDLVATLPAQIDRKAGAELVTAHVFPVSAHTVKAWPLPWSCPNGRAVASPVSYLTYAYGKVRQANATTNRWRRPATQSADAA